MNIVREREIFIDFNTPKPVSAISFLQYDTSIIKFIIEDNGAPADLSKLTNIIVNFRRPDKKVISQVLTADGNEILYKLTESEMLKVGECELSLQLYAGEDRLSIAKFKVFISDNIESGEAPTVEDVSLITQIIDNVNERLAELDESGNGLTDLENALESKTSQIYVDSQLNLKRDKNVTIKSTDLDTSNDENKIKLVNLSREVHQAMSTPLRGERGEPGPKGEPGLGDSRLDGFMVNLQPISSSENYLINGVSNVIALDDHTIRYVSSSNYGHIGLRIPNDQTRKYLAVIKIINEGNISTGSYTNLMIGYGSGQYESVWENGEILSIIGSITASSTYETVIQFNTDDNTAIGDADYEYAILGLFTPTAGVIIQLSQKVYDVTNLTSEEINSIDWTTIQNNTMLKATYAERSGTANTLAYKGSSWQGKNWLSLGDSITSPGIYQDMLKDILGFETVVNKGIPGQSVVTMANNITDSELSSADLITLYGAFNDFYPNAPALGTVTDIPNDDGDTFLSKLKYVIESILTRKPTAKLVIIGTHNGADQYRPQIYRPIRDGKNIGDYVAGMGEVARYYGLPFIDLYGESGINEISLSTYTTDGLHLNETGYKRIASVIAGELQTIEPS